MNLVLSYPCDGTVVTQPHSSAKVVEVFKFTLMRCNAHSAMMTQVQGYKRRMWRMLGSCTAWLVQLLQATKAQKAKKMLRHEGMHAH
jgi:hypothetical protein